MQLLLLEDDDELRGEICEFLMRRRHAVTAVGSVAEARRVLPLLLSSSEPLDAVICDINLQDGDGVDLYISFGSRHPACRWVLMSGDPDPLRLAAVQSAHPTLPRCVVIEKPVSLRDLAESLVADSDRA